MDKQNQKPTVEMLAEARRLAFFSDAVLSQEITDSYEKTDAYIKRHTQQLIEQKVIKPTVEYYAYTPEEIKAYNKWFNSLLWKAVYFLVWMYLFISWYFISTPMESWIFNIGQYNSLLLQWFPNAQYWVNISTEHREKMILLYVIYCFFLWFILLSIMYHIVINVKKFTIEYVPARAKLCGRLGVGLAGMFMFTSFAFFALFGGLIQGSESFLMPDMLDNSSRQWMFRDNTRWNSIIGFLLNKSLNLVILSFLLWGLRSASATWFCKKMSK